MRTIVHGIRSVLYAPLELAQLVGLPLSFQLFILRVVLFLDRPARSYLISCR